MALQGNLRDFASTEILQLLGTQKKSGCLALEWGTEKAVVWVQEGRIVSTRPTGVSKVAVMPSSARRRAPTRTSARAPGSVATDSTCPRTCGFIRRPSSRSLNSTATPSSVRKSWNRRVLAAKYASIVP